MNSKILKRQSSYIFSNLLNFSYHIESSCRINILLRVFSNLIYFQALSEQPYTIQYSFSTSTIKQTTSRFQLRFMNQNGLPSLMNKITIYGPAGSPKYQVRGFFTRHRHDTNLISSKQQH